MDWILVYLLLSIITIGTVLGIGVVRGMRAARRQRAERALALRFYGERR